MNLFSFTEPTECTYNIHNSVVFYHFSMFHHYRAILREFLYKVLEVAKI
jgi:hypothetical protein